MANSVYVSALGDLEREVVFSNVVDFFNETWKNKPKPFKLNQRIVKKKHLTTEVAQASRNTTSQTITFVGEDGIIRYNKRKITELPGFIEQMTPNISIPLASKHIYFNYEFLHGMFACTPASEIFESLKTFSNGSSYTLSGEALLALKELKFLNFLFIQCIMSMNDYADSIATQILSRTLIFNGSIPLLTELFKQADDNSKNHCALIAPYQSLPPPGIGPLFALEKHSKPIYCTLLVAGEVVFTLSTKLHAISLAGLINLGEIELPKLNEPDHYKQMIINFEESSESSGKFSSLKLIKGKVIVISNHTLYSINLDSTSSIIKICEDKIINSIRHLSPKHVLVTYEQESYFEIYNFFSGQVVFVQNFDFKIKLFPFTNSEEFSFSSDFVETPVVVLVLENFEIKFITLNIENIEDIGEVKIKEEYTFKSPGIECIDVRINKEDSIFFSFKDGSMFLLNEEIRFLKPKLEETKSKLTFKYLDFHNSSDSYLLLGDDQFVYIMFIYDQNSNEGDLVKISDHNKYSDARILSEGIIICISKGAIDVYRVCEKNNAFRGVLQMSFDAHFMDITSIFVRDGLLFTSSKDSVFKAFHFGSMQMNTQYNFKLIRSKHEISYLFQISYLLFGTYSNESS